MAIAPENIAGISYPKAKPKAKPKPKAKAKAQTIAQSNAAEIARIKAIAATNPTAPSGTTYNQRVVEAIKSGTQSTTDVNGNLVPDRGVAYYTPEGQLGGYYATKGNTPDESSDNITDETRDAFEIMKQTLRGWGLEDLAEIYGSLMITGMSSNAAMTKIKYDKSINPATNRPWNDAYNTRFKGNELRVAKGLNAYTEGDYLDVENAYNDTLTRYGLSNMIKSDAAGKRAQFAGYIGNDIAPPEFAERIKNVSERVLNMDPRIKAQFQAYYPSLTHTDLVSYFLDPNETLPVLKNKITAAEIGAVAGAAAPKNQYGISETRAMDLAKFGVTRAQALTGYQDIAEVLPTGMKLSNVYGEEGIQYGQTTAEDEYLKQDAQAKIKRNRLASKERASFQGSSGNTSGSLKKLTAGQI